MVELIDIINASQGRNKDGAPKSGLALSEQIMDSVGKVRTLKENVFTTPEVKFIFNGDFILIDLKFSSEKPAEIRVFWNYLENFGKEQHSHFGLEESPILHLSVMPLDFAGKYFYTLINPICWTMQPATPGAPVNTIRLLFEKDALNLFQSEGVDDKEIDKEIEQEEHEEARIAQLEEEKNREHEEYLKRLNERFNSQE